MSWIMLVLVPALMYLVLICPACSSRGRNALAKETWYAHRGLHDENVSENSLKAFAMAAECGYGIELDVRLTKDEQLIVFHDETLKRLCGREDAIRELTWEQLRQVCLPDGQRIPLLEEVIGLISGRVPLLVEIKSSRIGDCRVSEKLHEMLKDYDGRYTVQSFDPFQLRWFKRHAPQVIRGQLAQRAEWNGPFRLRSIPMMMAGCLVFNRISVPDYVAYRMEDTNRFTYCMMRRVYRPGLAVWTVRSAAEAEKMKAICDAVIFESFRPQK